MPRSRKIKPQAVSDEMIRSRFVILRSLNKGDAERAIKDTAFVFRLQGVSETRVRSIADAVATR